MTKGKAWIVVALVWVAIWCSQLQGADERTDLQILIDVSGSMKKNEPKNLRRPAL